MPLIQRIISVTDKDSATQRNTYRSARTSEFPWCLSPLRNDMHSTPWSKPISDVKSECITSGIKSTPGRVAEAVSTRAVKILWKFHEAKLQQQQSKTRRWHQTTTTRYDNTATWHAIWDQSVDTRSGGHLQWQVPSSELRKRELEVNAQVKNKLRSQDKEILRYDTSWLHVIMNIYYE